MNTRILSIKFREILFRFQQLTTQKKIVLGLIFLAGITVIIGTISIITISITQIEGKNRKEALQEFYSELEGIRESIDSNLEEYGHDRLEEKFTKVNDDYTTYSDELKRIEENLDKISLPLSAPINE
jgi:hypothetical protein